MRVFTVPPETSFVDCLALGLIGQAGGAPEALTRQLVLLPTRRACRALREAVLRAGEGRPLLLPRLRPIGDVDLDDLVLAGGDSELGAEGVAGLPPAIEGMRRALLLAQLILAREADLAADQAVWLAAALARFLDEAQTERLGFAALAELVPLAQGEWARHWQATVRFLQIVTAYWPERLARERAVDPAAWRNAVLSAQAKHWRVQPPEHPVIAAGSTGSIPATADLLQVIAGLPHGAVILPGLDRHLSAAAWARVAEQPSHPQHGLALLLAKFGLEREQVADWPGAAPATGGRAAFLARALAPADAAVAAPDAADVAAARAEWQAGLAYAECAEPQEEATTIALLLREALETPGRRAALVTPDRDLARRVAAGLKRWGVAIDDSAGTPLSATPPGAFLRLLLDAAGERFAPVPMLALLKHPLAAGGLAPGAFRAGVRAAEIAAWRGLRPEPGLAGLRARLAAEAGARRHLFWFDRVAGALQPLEGALARPREDIRALAFALIRAAEALAATDAETGAARLWAGEAGEAAAGFVDELRAAAADFDAIAPAHFPPLFEALMAGRMVRPRFGTHPRLAILGPLEARLQHHDLVVLGGLNEGVWPRLPEADPWMSRPMRKAFGLPPSERRIGLSAHDFAQAAAAPRVIFTRSRRVGGQPMPPSRWLLRIEAELRRLGLITEDGAAAGIAWAAAPALDWAQALDRAPAARPPVDAPEPRPPFEARPRKLRVTEIATWRRNPYAIYAKHVLGLEPLEELDQEPDVAEFGTLVHRAIEAFLKNHAEGPLPANALEALHEEGRRALAPIAQRPEIWAFWRPRFERIAAWFVREERRRRGDLARVAVEARGTAAIEAGRAPFELTGAADRIDIRKDGSLVVGDYKTGTVPSAPQVAAGWYPQLPLLAALIGLGGFKADHGIAADATVADLEYWRLTGRGEGGEVKSVARKIDATVLAADALKGLENLIAAFDNPATPYAARPFPDVPVRHDDYDHLARVDEWSDRDGEGDW